MRNVAINHNCIFHFYSLFFVHVFKMFSLISFLPTRDTLMRVHKNATSILFPFFFNEYLNFSRKPSEYINTSLRSLSVYKKISFESSVFWKFSITNFNFLLYSFIRFFYMFINAYKYSQNVQKNISFLNSTVCYC